MKIVYSLNKRGYEAAFWMREIAAAGTPEVTFIPFNHDPYVDVRLYLRAQQLDDLWFKQDPGLLRMYTDLEKLIETSGAVALIVDNCFPYHPDYLRGVGIYKVLRTTDGPMTAYDRDLAYLHAYDHVLYHSPAYSRDLSMEEKLRYCGAKTIDWWPLGVFDAAWDPSMGEDELFSIRRDVDVVFVGAMHPNKMPMLARIKKALGSKLRLHGLTSLKKNVYFNVRYGFPAWVRPLEWERYVPLYQRSRIGINLHNRGDYTVGNYRMFELPANGVFQLSDGGEFLSRFFEPGREIAGYTSPEDLLGKIDYYLTHDDERVEVARQGYRRVLRDYRISNLLLRAASLIGSAMKTHPARNRESSS